MTSAGNISGLKGQLKKLVEYNRSMLKNAEAGNWDKVIEAELKRREMLEAFYSSSEIQKVADVTEATREMLEINKALEKLFSPEFRNRLDSVIHFGKLPLEVIKKVAQKFIEIENALGKL